MNYHAPTKQFTVSVKDLEHAAENLRYAMRHIRMLAGLPMTPHKRESFMTSADHAQKGILDAAKVIGIDMGAEWGEQLDLSDGQE